MDDGESNKQDRYAKVAELLKTWTIEDDAADARRYRRLVKLLGNADGPRITKLHPDYWTLFPFGVAPAQIFAIQNFGDLDELSAWLESPAGAGVAARLDTETNS